MSSPSLLKAQPALRVALEKHTGEELQVVLALMIRPRDKSADPPAHTFPSAVAWQQDLRERQQAHVEREIGPTLVRLRELGLRLLNAGILGVLIVEGTDAQLLQALEIPEVEVAAFPPRIERMRTVPCPVAVP